MNLENQLCQIRQGFTMRILDTQIISYAFKGKYDGLITQQHISSVTAKEFLLIQGAEQSSANYYVPLANRLINSNSIQKRDHPFPKTSTDQIILNFGGDYPSMLELGNLAITEIINSHLESLFKASIQFLKKEERKTILDRFEFLLYHNINCIPLTHPIIELGLSLLYEFLQRYTPKENIRNTINDIFIVATTINASGSLITNDKLLNKFVSEYCDAKIEGDSDIVIIDFSKKQTLERRISKESKGYINRGWQIRTTKDSGFW